MVKSLLPIRNHYEGRSDACTSVIFALYLQPLCVDCFQIECTDYHGYVVLPWLQPGCVNCVGCFQTDTGWCPGGGAKLPDGKCECTDLFEGKFCQIPKGET